ncbi:MAG: rhomboid family intramembrane serine protease, partial [Acidobacteria bacterium]|nr:rhomboid family intramembrane serine protease [Acidobacteriota bacterium]
MPADVSIDLEPAPRPLPPGVRFAVALHQLTPSAPLTPTLIAVNVAVWIAMLANGANPLSPDTEVMRAWGADFGPLTANGEWWRLLTSNYLHFGAIHLFCNMFALWQIGALVERLLGRSGFLITYLISGVAGSLASLWWHPYAVGAGASGAVFGVYGALLGFITRESGTIPREVLSRLRSGGVTFLGYNLIFGLSIPGISLAAHAGGLAAGFLCGVLLSHQLTIQGASTRARRSLVLATLGVVGISAAVAVFPPPFDFEGELEAYRVVAGET